MMSQFQTLRAPKTPSRKVRILSSKRLTPLLRRGLRFEAAVPMNGATLRAALSVRGRTVGTVRRTRLSRGRVKVTLPLSRSGKARLARLLRGRRGARALLKVTAGGDTRQARFIIGR